MVFPFPCFASIRQWMTSLCLESLWFVMNHAHKVMWCRSRTQAIKNVFVEHHMNCNASTTKFSILIPSSPKFWCFVMFSRIFHLPKKEDKKEIPCEWWVALTLWPKMVEDKNISSFNLGHFLAARDPPTFVFNFGQESYVNWVSYLFLLSFCRNESLDDFQAAPR